MPKLTKHCTDRLNKVPLSGLLPVEGTGSTLHGKCPKCGKSGKIKSKWQGLYVVDNDRSGKHYAGCTSCSFKAGGGAINVMMKFHDVTFPQACEMISNQTGIELEYEQEPVSRKNTMQPAPQPDARSFCMQQLTASGLTLDDVRAKVLIDGVETVISPFQKGCIDIMTGKIDNLADEMLILYYDIEGRRKTFIPSKNKTKEMPYGRNRWANPDAHPDKSGKPIKYQTPYGAKGSEFYIPQKIRTKYKNHIDIPTLYIQEGEKKAEKACKHGIDSIAIQGISNTGRKEEGLPPELQYLVKRCNIQKIVFLMDADWNEISTNITDGSFIDTRPKAFARAVIKFKKYVGTLNQCGLFVDIWYAHINKNIAGDKGIDDLLCNTLHGREHLFLEDISRAMEAHDGKGTYADIMNITSWSDSKIMDLWSLNNKDDFFERHRERLLSLHSFRFSDVAYKIEDGKIIADSEFGCGQDFWSSWHEEKNGRIKKHVEIDLVYLKAWLHANGFRVRIGEDGKPSFLRIEGGIVKAKHEILIRRFVLDHVNKSTKDHDIHVYMAENIANKLSLPNLCQLDMIDEISVRDYGT